MHPRIKSLFESNNFKYQNYSEIITIPPVSYIDMIHLEKNSRLIFTDSGGVQKEAYWAKTYCITLREETEWPELLHTKMNVLTGLDRVKICQEFFEFVFYKKPFFNFEIYGDGKTGQKILEILKNNWGIT
jgi:UDP-GlcNAc3NAcA epimerase